MQKKYFPVILIVLTFAIIGCNMKKKADFILVNGLVYTVDSAFTVTQSFAVADGLFLATGTTEEILGSYEADLIIDAGGKPVYPGFIDGHCHFFGYAINKYQYLDLKGTNSFSQVISMLKEQKRKNFSGWILGRGWDQNDWQVKEFPDKTLLDELFPANPVVLTRIDGHALLANSEALRQAGINPNTRIEGGEILKNNGKLTGILLDNAADRMKAMIPPPDVSSLESALVTAQEDCFRAGLTSIVDAGLEYDTVMLIDSLQQSGKLRIRINAMLSPTEKNLAGFVRRGPFQKERLTVNSLKLYADGALGSRGALLLEPYSDEPGSTGLLLSSQDYFRDMLDEASQNNFQVNTHCIGDSANRLILNLYGEVLKGANDKRWRIEHAQVIHPDDFKLFAKYNIIPSVQTTHCTSDMYWAENRLGVERVKGAYAYKKLLDQNGWIINGTDFPIEEIHPLLTFYAAVSRQDLQGYPEGGFQPENALSREEALRSMTIWAAKGSFEEKSKGSIEPGKVADFVIIDRDIMKIPFKDIPEATILKTYLNGELVFE